MIGALTGQGNNVRHACRFLGVTESGYYAWRSRPTSPRALRRIFLAGQIVDVHRASAGIYGTHRITAELRFGRQIIAGRLHAGSIDSPAGDPPHPDDETAHANEIRKRQLAFAPRAKWRGSTRSAFPPRVGRFVGASVAGVPVLPGA